MINPKIEQLKQRVEANKAWREQEMARTQAMRDRIKMIREAKPRTMTDFWCSKCDKDVNARGYRQIREPKGFPPIAWYVGYCPKGHEVIRRITDKGNDPYYNLSRFVKIQRRRLEKDLVQPSDPRFKTLYPAQWKKIQEDKERAEMEAQLTLKTHGN